MPELLLTRVLPNPPGKDRTFGRPSNDQLNAERIEFKNTTERSLSLEAVSIFHFTFDRSCVKTGEDRLTTFRGTLNPGWTIRLHTGSGTAWDEGHLTHLYIGRANYAWNNVCGDTAALRNSHGSLVDWAAYGANPPEGVILNRVPGTNKFSASQVRRTA
jgi:hypothetical protein